MLGRIFGTILWKLLIRPRCCRPLPLLLNILAIEAELLDRFESLEVVDFSLDPRHLPRKLVDPLDLPRIRPPSRQSRDARWFDGFLASAVTRIDAS